MAQERRVMVFGVGDVFPDVDDGRASFAPLTPLLRSADIVFGNCEGVYSDRPSPAPSHKHFNGAARARGDFLGEVPFHVMTAANNHIVDGGYEGLADTLELLRAQGIQTTGAGVDIDEATRPAILEREGVRVAFLGFASVFPVGYEARAHRPGLAPLRVRTYYGDPDPNFWEPGIAPLIQTVAQADDLARFRASIAAAREQADFVVVAPHWGYSSWMEVLQDYELELARDAVEHGADAVMCCHHHSLRGVELYRGRPIFYGLGALIHHFNSIRITRTDRVEREARFGGRSSFAAEEEFPLFPFRADARKTGIAVLSLGRDGTLETGFIPAHMLADGATEPLAVEDPRAEDVAAYIERLSAQSGFRTRFERDSYEGWMLLRISAARPNA
jgi:poly-gamma-glutamate capsule biosynthesis protein CapA/YwtB (metallophosphatase superfamily)